MREANNYLNFASNIAYLGGQIIRDEAARRPHIELKADNTFVTDIDKRINQKIVSAIRETYPEHGVLGEEQSYGSGAEEFTWIVDPLDGTRAYLLGVPVSTCIVGLAQAGRMKVAAVYDPFADRLFNAERGKGAFCDNKPIKVSTDKLGKSAIVLVSESSFKFSHGITRTGAQVEPLPGAGYRSMLVALGRCAASIQGSGSAYDMAPSSLIVQEAGGKVSNLDGEEILWDRPSKRGIVLSNAAAHDQLLEIARKN
jgi:myo-inositol-1(or 4)-monophosphatase